MKVAASREAFIAQLEKRGYKHSGDIPSLFGEEIEVTMVYSRRKSFTQYWVYSDHATCVLVKIAEIALKEVYVFTGEQEGGSL
jgi:hypothetical protein